MVYVPGYEKDVFISYAHVDDSITPPAEKGWVTTFVECINSKLKQELGNNYSPWFDPEMCRNEKITTYLKEILRHSATMILILSPGYIDSVWCNMEKNTFLKFVKGNISRVFIVKRIFVEEENLPNELKEIPGYQFWVYDDMKKIRRTLGVPVLVKDYSEYYSMLDILVDQLVKKLKELKGEKRIQVKTPQSTIFLAQVTDDLEHERNNVKSYFEQSGIGVLPNSCYHLNSNQFRECLVHDLAQCEVFVQLLSGVSGKKPPDLPQGFLTLQLECARSANKTIYQWRDPSLNLDDIKDEDPNHYALVGGDNVRAESIEDFKRAIKDLLQKPKEIKEIKISTLVFVNSEVADQPLAEKIGNFLDTHDIAWSLPPDKDNNDPGEFRTIYEENLKECNGIIIVYGSSPASWVNHQLNEYLKIRGNNNPPRFFAIFEGPPEQKSKIPIHINNMQILNFRKGIDEELLEAQLNNFIEKLREDK
jgi:hypothetical protein